MVGLVNIFVLDRDPRLAAQYHCDKHVGKMLLESVQILSTVAHLRNFWISSMYKPTHRNHPCVQWAAESVGNYAWLKSLAWHLGLEFEYRYNKFHKSSYVLVEQFSLEEIYKEDPTSPFMLCMPDEYKTNDPVESYRNYYHSKSFAKWEKGRKAPSWWKING